jgi:hypothetical protein
MSSRDIEQFCQIDGGWAMRRGSNHIIATKYLDDGSRLVVQICHNETKEFSPGASQRICRQQLGLAGGEAQMHEVLRTKKAPVRERVAPEPQMDELTVEMAEALTYECQVGAYQMTGLTEADGQAIRGAHRFGVAVGKMEPHQLQVALAVCREHSVEEPLQLYEIFEGASADLKAGEIAELVELRSASIAL